jgi:hypothetical protein
MKISLSNEKRMIILTALSYLMDAEQVKDSSFSLETINSLFYELQPTGVAVDAEVGDFVMLNEECREVAEKYQEGALVTLFLKPEYDFEDDIWTGVYATDVSWPGIIRKPELSS